MNNNLNDNFDLDFNIQMLKNKINNVQNKLNINDLPKNELINTRICFEISKKIESYIETSMSIDGLVGESWIVLMVIYSENNSSLYASDMCKYLVKSKATMSRIIESLKLKKFIEEIENKDDRRKTSLNVTKKGEKYIENKLKTHSIFYKSIYENVNVSLINNEMEKLLQNINNYKKD